MRYLDPQRVLETLAALEQRISERFAGSSLQRVVADVRRHGEESESAIRRIQRADWRIRLGTLVIVGVAGVIGWALVSKIVRQDAAWWSPTSGPEFLGVVENALATVVFLSAGLAFLWGLDTRLRRRLILARLHDLRSLAHVVDMHQLRKDPDRLRKDRVNTASSPTEEMSPFEASRYLDYCSEALSLISKLAALHVQGYPDPVAVAGVDEIERLCTGLARKIWQKIMILDRLLGDGGASSEPATGSTVG